MTSRSLRRHVAQALEAAGGARPLLDAAAECMTQSPARSDSGKTGKILRHLKLFLRQDDGLGQIYQAINAPALEAAYRQTAIRRRKFRKSEIPAVTQLFTPKWVVEFLLQNTLGMLWRQMHPDTRLVRRWPWLLQNGPVRRLPARPIRDIRLCDPACGTMNFGLVAVDMFRQMYREEIARAGEPSWPSPSCEHADQIDCSILENNLFGTDIDPIAIDLARRGLAIKIGAPPGRHHLRVADALFDDRSLGKFDVIVTNPPFLSARNVDSKTVARWKKKYPAAWRDAYACFLVRALDLLKPGGRAGILSMHSFMFTAAYERLRRELLSSASLEALAHFGPGLFDIGNPGTLQTAALVMRKEADPHGKAIFIRLIDAPDKRMALRKAADRFEVSQSDLSSLPRSAWMYWISPKTRDAFRNFPKLGQIAPPRQGLATTDNFRFVRYWWEVEPPGFSGPRGKWRPYAKGGRFRRWYEAARHRVNWQDDGREIKREIVRRYPYLDGKWQWVAKNSAWYGREGITYSYLTSGAFSARRLEQGTIFDVAGSSLFPDDLPAVLGILNSSCAGQFLAAINPTVNFQVGDLAELPMPPSIPDELRRRVDRAIELTRLLDQFDETSPDFRRPMPWDASVSSAALWQTELSEIQIDVDRLVALAYGMDCPAGQRFAPTTDHSTDLAFRWLSYALGTWLGRWGGKPRGDVAILSPLDARFASEIRQILAEHVGGKSAKNLEAAVKGLERFFARDFLPWHHRLYRGRPVFWGFSGNDRVEVISSLWAEPALLRSICRRLGASPPKDFLADSDEPISARLAPLAPILFDKSLVRTAWR